MISFIIQLLMLITALLPGQMKVEALNKRTSSIESSMEISLKEQPITIEMFYWKKIQSFPSALFLLLFIREQKEEEEEEEEENRNNNNNNGISREGEEKNQR